MSKKDKLQTPERCTANFKEVFRRLTQQHGFSEVWADFVEIAAICIHQQAYFNPDWMPAELEAHTLPIDDEFRRLEERYMSFVPKYGSEGMTLLSHLYGISEYAVRTHRIDFLGPLYESLDLSGASQRGSRGEFFTPASISQLMASMTLANVEELMEANGGYIRLSEPCVGAGGMVVAVANQLVELGHNPSEMLMVEAIDVNRTFFNIAYFQLSALDLCGRVWCGNTLSLEISEYRETPHLKLSRHHWNQRPEFKMLKFLREIESQTQQVLQTLEKAQSASSAAGSDDSWNPMPSEIEGSGQLRLF